MKSWWNIADVRFCLLFSKTMCYRWLGNTEMHIRKKGYIINNNWQVLRNQIQHTVWTNYYLITLHMMECAICFIPHQWVIDFITILASNVKRNAIGQCLHISVTKTSMMNCVCWPTFPLFMFHILIAISVWSVSLNSLFWLLYINVKVYHWIRYFDDEQYEW